MTVDATVSLRRNQSPELDLARDLVASVRSRSLSTEIRAQMAVELAGYLLSAARYHRTSEDKSVEQRLSRLMDDANGKAFTTALTDQCFRTENRGRVADQLRHLVDDYGVPSFLRWWERAGLFALARLAPIAPGILVPQLRYQLRRDTARVILPGEQERLRRHLQQRRKDGVRTNVNHLGEAILGEAEAENRLQKYVSALSSDNIDYISVKLSTIGSQLSVLDFDGTIARVTPRLRRLYRAALKHTPKKFINLDMEEYDDLELTLELFMRVLDEPEFHTLPAGIVLQAYLPDAHGAYARLLKWAKKRRSYGGAPIKMRVVKGANLAMERFHSALHHWPQAPYPNKSQVDASFKHLLDTAFQQDAASAIHVGVASHNVFDLSWAMLLRSERELEAYVGFEMLEGMADPIRKVVQAISGGMLLYCPAASEADFSSAIAYLVRRLDENTSPENFLRHAFGLLPNTPEFQAQASKFIDACSAAPTVPTGSRRYQDRSKPGVRRNLEDPFVGEPSTDWTSAVNRSWVRTSLAATRDEIISTIPLAIGGDTDVLSEQVGSGYDPSNPDSIRYTYALANWDQVNLALDTAVNVRVGWAELSAQDRAETLLDVAQVLRRQRGELLAAMVLDGGKTVAEADPELCEAIDFLEYYARSAVFWGQMPGIKMSPLGTVLVTPPWNFPLAIPLGGVAASLVMGNAVLLKPAPETVWVGRKIAEAFWEAGVNPAVLQLIMCPDAPVGSRLVADRRVDAVILTGATATAELFLSVRPDLHLIAETGGKNAIILTSMSDRDLAVKDVVQSAFGHAGQKCSAASVLICEGEVYDDPKFKRQLVDAAASLEVGSAWDLSTTIGPLIGAPGRILSEGLTALTDGESWALQPVSLDSRENLWSPGIRWGVQPGAGAHTTEFFGPVLAVIRADDLEHAVGIANSTPYGLTSGIHSLDSREVDYWLTHIVAGNLYVNRGITGAVVQRQPFGGCKASGFGRGAKAGGINYVSQLVTIADGQIEELPHQEPNQIVQSALNSVSSEMVSEAELLWLRAAAGSDAHYHETHFSRSHDPTNLVGQDNRFEYRVRPGLLLRVGGLDANVHVIRAVLAALAGTIEITVVLLPGHHTGLNDWLKKHGLRVRVLSDPQLADEVKVSQSGYFIRCLSTPSEALAESVIGTPSRLNVIPCVASGRVEGLHYRREVSISFDYHRYGNLGTRESEERHGPETITWR